jgi:serine/threonine protein kinase
MKFGRFTLQRLLGAGAMGEIYLAHIPSPLGVSKPCIIKRLKPKFKNNPKTITRFEDEMRILAKLQHPNIVNAFEFGEIEGQKYLAMEYVDGMSLRKLLENHSTTQPTLTKEFALYILIHVARGLHYLHDPKINGQMTIVHRDLAPDNILLARNGEIKISDFGLAKTDENLTESTDGSIKGHVYYMAPEQARGEIVDTNADIFSFGTIAYELLVGKTFFDFSTHTVGEALRDVAAYSQAKHPLAHLQIAPSIKQFLLSLLHEKPQKRLQPAAVILPVLNELMFPKAIDSVAPDFLDFIRQQKALQKQETDPHLSPMAKTLSVSEGNNVLTDTPSNSSGETPTASATKAIPVELLFSFFKNRLNDLKPRRKFRLWRLKTIFKLLLACFAIGALIVIGLEEGVIPEKPLKKLTTSFSSSTSTPTIFSASCYVQTDPPGARIQISGRQGVFYTPFTFDNLKPSTNYTITIDNPGYQPYQEKFTLKPAERKILIIALNKTLMK